MKDMTAFRLNKKDQIAESHPARGTTLKIGDMVLVRDHPPGRVKTKDQYRPDPGRIVSVPGPMGGYFSVDFADKKAQAFTGSELRKYLPSEESSEGLSPEAESVVDETIERPKRVVRLPTKLSDYIVSAIDILKF